jgi:hypothetical protein
VNLPCWLRAVVTSAASNEASDSASAVMVDPRPTVAVPAVAG